MKQIREEQGLSRGDMSKKLGISQSALWKIEHNRAYPKESTITRFCFALGIPPARFYTLAFEPRDFAPIPSVQDCLEAMHDSDQFTEEEMKDITGRLARSSEKI